MKAKRLDAIITAFVILSILTCLTIAFAQQQSLFKQIPDEIKKYNFYKRWEWFQTPRIFPFDTISIHTYHRELDRETKFHNQMLRKTSQSPLLGLPAWKHLGPPSVRNGNVLYSGRVRGIAVHPSNPDIVYIGAASGGLWKSINGGASWQNLSDDFACNTFGAIAIDPNNPDIVYAGTGEVKSSGVRNIYDGRGLYKSTNGGATWTQITDGFGLITQFADIEVSPHNSNIVFAALGNGYSHSNSFLNNEGIWRSDDGGITWIRTLVAQNSFNYDAAAYDVIVHPTDPNRIYAALGMSTPSGFYVSIDNGRTWSPSNSGLPDAIERIQIALSPAAPATIYAVIFSTSFTPYRTRLFKSIDNGGTWNQIAATKEFGAGGNDQGSYDLCIAVHPLDEKIVYVGNIEISTSTDGTNFSYLNGNMHVDFHKIVFAPSNSDYIYVGCDGGIYRSTDGGNIFTAKNDRLSTLQLYMMASHPTNKAMLIAGSQDNGGFYTQNSGATPWILNAGGDISGVFYDHANPNIAYAVAFWRSLSKSSNGGISFSTSLGSNFDRGLEGFFLIHPTKPNWLYCAKDKKVIRSENGGTSWTPISAELTKWPFATMDQSHVNPNIMILASIAVNRDNPQVMVSIDEGLNWSEVTANIPGEPRFISRVVAHPTEENTLFVVRSGYGSGKIYRSTNLGNTWEDITSDLPDIPHSDLFVDPANPSLYFVANDFGVYGSQDAGQTWTRLGNGMPFVVATDLDYYNYNGERLLRVATYGRGAYETDLNQVPDWTAPQIKLTAPKPGEKIMAGVPDTIRWNASDNSAIFTIEIQYSLNNGTTWNPFPAVTLNVNELLWETPLINSRSCWIRAQAQDAEGNQGTNSVGPFTINRPPVIIQSADTTILEDEPFAMKLSVEHVDPGDTIKFFDNCSFLNIHESSGEISFTPTNEQVGKHLIELRAFDGVDSDTTQFYLTVENLNDAPQAFQLISPPNLTIINTLNPALQWTESKDVDVGDSLYYRLWLAEDSTFSIIIRDENLTQTTLLIDSGLVCDRRYFWQVFAIDRDSAVTACSKSYSFQTSATATGIKADPDILLTAFALHQNHPNPFNPTTTISYTIAKSSHVKLLVYNALGQVVAVLVDGIQAQGSYSIAWDAQHQPSGLYLCRFEADGFTATRKMFLQK